MSNDPRDPDPSSLRIPLTEETLDITVRERQEGVVRFTRRVEIDPVETLVDVQSDDVFIERHPRDEIVDQTRQPWHDGDTMIIPVYEERLVIEKRLVLTEEIHVRRTVKTEQVPVQHMLRREVVDIEAEDVPLNE